MLVDADQKLADGVVPLNTVVANVGLPPRALCMRMPTWTCTITVSHSQASSWLCALLKCASQGTILLLQARETSFQGLHASTESCMTIMNSGHIMWHNAHLQVAILQHFCIVQTSPYCIWLLAKRCKVEHNCNEAPVCRQASHAVATGPSASNKRQGRGW